MTDANQAPSNGIWQPGVRWNFTRALDTDRELTRMNGYWFEEPLLRYDYDGLAELNRLADIPLAGGENNRGVHEFLTMIEKGSLDILQPEIMVTEGVQGGDSWGPSRRFTSSAPGLTATGSS